MLYSFELMNKVCNDLLPLSKDVNNLISEYILTSDHIDFMLFKVRTKCRNRSCHA